MIADTPIPLVPVIAPEVAVIVNAPVVAAAVAKPALLIVTTLLFADQVTVAVKSRVVLSL